MTRTKVYVIDRGPVQEIFGEEGKNELKRNYTFFDSPTLFYLPSIPLVLGGNIIHKSEDNIENIEKKFREIMGIEIKYSSSHPLIIEWAKKKMEGGDYVREIKTKKEWLSHIQCDGDSMNRSRDQLNMTILALFDGEKGVIEEEKKELEEKLRHVEHK